VLARCGDAPADSLHDILDADRLARETAAKVLDCGVKP
jgi:hypothetical protein